MKNRLLTGIYTAILFLSYNAVVFAQQDDIDEHPADDDPDPTATVPIDQHMIWLLVAGLLFACFIYKRRKFFIR